MSGLPLTLLICATTLQTPATTSYWVSSLSSASSSATRSPPPSSTSPASKIRTPQKAGPSLRPTRYNPTTKEGHYAIRKTGVRYLGARSNSHCSRPLCGDLETQQCQIEVQNWHSSQGTDRNDSGNGQ